MLTKEGNDDVICVLARLVKVQFHFQLDIKIEASTNR